MNLDWKPDQITVEVPSIYIIYEFKLKQGLSLVGWFVKVIKEGMFLWASTAGSLGEPVS